MRKFLFGKIAFAAIFLIFFVSCQNAKAPCWELEARKAPCPQFNATRIYYVSPCATEALTVQIEIGHEGLRMYLDLYICPVGCDEAQSQSISFDYIAMGTPHKGNGYVLEGGQRILLDDRTTEEMISFLLKGYDLVISVGMYEEIVRADNFGCLFSGS